MTTPPQIDSDAIDRLADEIAKFNNHRFVRISNSLWYTVGYQFLRGLSFGLGSALGATILVSLLGWWIAQFQFLPVIGDWAAQLVDHIQKAR